MDHERHNDTVIIEMLKDIKDDVSKMRLWAFGETGGNGANSKLNAVCIQANTIETAVKDHKDSHKWHIGILVSVTAVVVAFLEIVFKK